MNTDLRRLPTLPRVATMFGARLPLALVAPVIEIVLARVFVRALAQGELDFLGRRELVLQVEDAGLVLAFRIENGRLRCRRPRHQDVCITGSAAAFVLLASGKADADMLFFQRLLVISGDTELGLGVKYLLEAMPATDMPPILRRLLDFPADWLAGQLAEPDDIPAAARQ